MFNNVSPTKNKVVISPKITPPTSPDKDSQLVEISLAEEKFGKIAMKMTDLNIAVDPSNPNGLRNTEFKLKEIIDDLTKFKQESQSNGDCKAIPTLSNDIEELLSQTTVLYGYISKQLKAMNRYDNEEESFDELELDRNEIAKLLILTSKLYNTKQIDLKQKGYIKDKIIRKEGYLRKMLQQEELGLNTLATFASLP